MRPDDHATPRRAPTGSEGGNYSRGAGEPVERMRCSLCGTILDITGFDDESRAAALTDHLVDQHPEWVASGGETSKPNPADLTDQFEPQNPSGAAGKGLDSEDDPSVGAVSEVEPAADGDDDAVSTDVHADAHSADAGAELSEAAPTTNPFSAGPSGAAQPDRASRGVSTGSTSDQHGVTQQPGPPGDSVQGGGGPAAGDPEAGTRGETGEESSPAVGEDNGESAPGATGARRGDSGDESQARKLASRVGIAGAGSQGSGIGDENASPGSKAADAAADAALEAGAAAAGVKPAVDAAEAIANQLGFSGKRVIKKAIKWTVVAAASFGVVLITGIFMGTVSNEAVDDDGKIWSVDEVDNLDIPAPYLEAYREYGAQYSIPWTLLAAVGAQATYHGRVNPYERDVPRVVARGGAAIGPVSGIYVLGDSLSIGTETPLAELSAGRPLTAVTEATSGISAGQLAANAYIKNPAPAGSAIIVGLGTNNNQSDPDGFARAIDTVMNSIGPSQQVYWLTLDVRDPENLAAGTTAEALNQQIRDAQSRWANLRVAEWAAYAASNGIAPGSDGIHYNGNGYRQRAEYIASLASSAVGGGASVTAVNLEGPGVLPTPEGRCPTLPQTVVGTASMQGAGPLMLNGEALSQLTNTTVRQDQIQNICWSVGKLAEHIREVAQQVADEKEIPFPRGLTNLAKQASDGDAEAAAAVAEFWATTMDRLLILGDARTVNCVMPKKGSLNDDQWIGAAINKIWACELSLVVLVTVDTVTTGAEGVTAQTTLPQIEAARRAATEALTVAWVWSSWGTTDCDVNNVGPAGVFPLTQTIFETYLPAELDGRDRCDPEANITAAARAFAAGESVNAAVRGAGWAGAAGGWAVAGTVPGDSDAADRFARNGPWEPMAANRNCLNLAFYELLELAQRTRVFDNLNAQTVQSYIDVEPSGPVGTSMRAELETLRLRVEADPRCAQTREYADAEWFGLIYTAFISDPAQPQEAGTGGGAAAGVTPTGGDTEVPVGEAYDEPGPTLPRPLLTSENLSVPAGVGDKFAALGTEAARLSISVTLVEPGETPLLQRLSPFKLRTPARPALTIIGGVASSGMEYANIATLYGGLYRGANQSGLLQSGMGNVGPPVPHAEIFNSVGTQYGVDPRLLAAVAKGESSFNPEANCPSIGPAYGMMQAEGVSEVCGDPRLQVERAAQMLLGLYEAAGDWRGAVWGYNNGIGFAQAWARNNGFNGDLGPGGAAYQYAEDEYCKDPARRARRASTGESWCVWRAGVATRYISDEPGTHSVWMFWVDYQQMFPETAFNASGSEIHIDYVTALGTPEVVRVEGFTVNVQIANEFAAMIRAARAAGIELRGGAYRSVESQIALRQAHCGISQYAIYEMPPKRCRPQTAKPGQSMHQQGLAADFMHNGAYLGSHSSPAFIWLAANAASYGFYNLPAEPWHWSVNGR